jgi:hypothetical protein
VEDVDSVIPQVKEVLAAEEIARFDAQQQAARAQFVPVADPTQSSPSHDLGF